MGRDALTRRWVTHATRVVKNHPFPGEPSRSLRDADAQMHLEAQARNIQGSLSIAPSIFRIPEVSHCLPTLGQERTMCWLS